MKVPVEYSQYLLVDTGNDETEQPVPSTSPGEVTVGRGRCIVTTVQQAGIALVEANDLDEAPTEVHGAWDLVSQVEVKVQGRLEVRTWDASPVRSSYPLIDQRGTWAMRLHVRFPAAGYSRGEACEDHYFEVWPLVVADPGLTSVTVCLSPERRRELDRAAVRYGSRDAAIEEAIRRLAADLS